MRSQLSREEAERLVQTFSDLILRVGIAIVLSSTALG